MSIPVHNLDSTSFRLSELSPYFKNPRRGHVSAIAESLSVNGQYRPIVVNLGSRTGRPLEVLAGNHTLAAARSLGWDSIAAVTVDVDEVAAARIVAADNRTADLGGYDDEVLGALLAGIRDEVGLEGTGYDDDFLDGLLDGVGDDADPGTSRERAESTGEVLSVIDVTMAEPEQEVHHGEVWRVGRHTLIVVKRWRGHPASPPSRGMPSRPGLGCPSALRGQGRRP